MLHRQRHHRPLRLPETNQAPPRSLTRTAITAPLPPWQADARLFTPSLPGVPQFPPSRSEVVGKIKVLVVGWPPKGPARFVEDVLGNPKLAPQSLRIQFSVRASFSLFSAQSAENEPDHLINGHRDRPAGLVRAPFGRFLLYPSFRRGLRLCHPSPLLLFPVTPAPPVNIPSHRSHSGISASISGRILVLPETGSTNETLLEKIRQGCSSALSVGAGLASAASAVAPSGVPCVVGARCVPNGLLLESGHLPWERDFEREAAPC